MHSSTLAFPKSRPYICALSREIRRTWLQLHNLSREIAAHVPARARNHIRQVHRDTRKMLLEDTIPKESGTKLAKSGDEFHLKMHVKSKLLAFSTGEPCTFFLGKFTAFSISVVTSLSSSKTSPSLVGNSRHSRRFRKCLVDPVIPSCWIISVVNCQRRRLGVLANLLTLRQTLSPDLSISWWQLVQEAPLQRDVSVVGVYPEMMNVSNVYFSSLLKTRILVKPRLTVNWWTNL